VQDVLEGRPAHLGASATSIAAAAFAIIIQLPTGSTGLGSIGSPLLGLLSSYQGLESNRLIALLSGALTVLTLASMPEPVGRRISFVALGLIVALSLAWFNQPVILAWLLASLFKALTARRVALASIVAVCALIPAFTKGTGSPTYALAVLMPCIVVTVLEFPWSPLLDRAAARLAVAAVVASLALLLALRAELYVPLISGLVAPLRAEKEKTLQLSEVLAWIDAHAEIGGRLSLCHSAEEPVRGGGGWER
jgi:hypothetical protein